MLYIKKYSDWIIRIIILGFGISLLMPIQSRAPIGIDKVVITKKPQVCVHTRLIDEVFEWKIQHSLELVREMGADTIVEFFPWAYIEAVEDQYNWEPVDRIVRHARNQGIKIIARTGFVPDWARPETDDAFSTLNYLPEESYDDFKDFVVAFAERYQGSIDHLIIWNEPNLAFEWGYQNVDAQQYLKLLKTVYEPLKQANPQITILAGALAPTLEPRGSTNGLNDLVYLEDLMQAGAGDYFDALAIHTYGFTESPEAAPAENTLNFRRAELLFDILNDYDPKPIYITESGWNDDPRWIYGIKPSERAIYTIRAFEWAENQWPQVEKLCIWAFRYPAPTYRYPDYFTLVTPGFITKPIYYALQNYALGKTEEEPLWLDPPIEVP
ncbi:hypothetical protein MASR2M15_21820 [Anaerolineales bacterium]